MAVLANSSISQDAYQTESDNIRERFEQSHNGRAAVRERSDLIDSLICELWSRYSAGSPGADKICVAALGGYGRRSLFPCSDVDVLFLHEAGLSETTQKQAISRVSQALWDRHLRVSPTTRSLAECGKLHRDNLEFNISLLDCRYLCGDADLFEQLRSRVIPKMVAREALELQQRLTDLTSARHEKYGHTIFHLEPNIKDYPGGLRDYQVACWLSLISELEKTGVWPAPENLLPAAFRQECDAALDFLSAVRCFLHYRQGRDLNGLTYELQSEAAAAGHRACGCDCRSRPPPGCEPTSVTCARFTGSPCCSMKCLRRAPACTNCSKIASRACPMRIFPWWKAGSFFVSWLRFRIRLCSSVFSSLSAVTA